MTGSAVYAALRDYFVRTGLEVDEHPDDGWVATTGFGEHDSWLLVGQALDDLGAAAIYAVLPERVPPERRDAAALLLTRINYGQALGAFELDLDDGEIRFRVAAVLVEGAPASLCLKPLVATALAQTDRWLPAIRALLAGEEPQQALAAARA